MMRALLLAASAAVATSTAPTPLITPANFETIVEDDSISDATLAVMNSAAFYAPKITKLNVFFCTTDPDTDTLGAAPPVASVFKTGFVPATWTLPAAGETQAPQSESTYNCWKYQITTPTGLAAGSVTEIKADTTVFIGTGGTPVGEPQAVVFTYRVGYPATAIFQSKVGNTWTALTEDNWASAAGEYRMRYTVPAGTAANAQAVYAKLADLDLEKIFTIPDGSSITTGDVTAEIASTSVHFYIPLDIVEAAAGVYDFVFVPFTAVGSDVPCTSAVCPAAADTATLQVGFSLEGVVSAILHDDTDPSPDMFWAAGAEVTVQVTGPSTLDTASLDIANLEVPAGFTVEDAAVNADDDATADYTVTIGEDVAPGKYTIKVLEGQIVLDADPFYNAPTEIYIYVGFPVTVTFEDEDGNVLEAAGLDPAKATFLVMSAEVGYNGRKGLESAQPGDSELITLPEEGGLAIGSGDVEVIAKPTAFGMPAQIRVPLDLSAADGNTDLSIAFRDYAVGDTDGFCTPVDAAGDLTLCPAVADPVIIVVAATPTVAVSDGNNELGGALDADGEYIDAPVGTWSSTVTITYTFPDPIAGTDSEKVAYGVAVKGPGSAFLPEPTVAVNGADLKVTFSELDSTATPGTYEIELVPNSMVDTESATPFYNVGVRVHIIIGYNIALLRLGSDPVPAYSRGLTGPIFTNLKVLNLFFLGADGSDAGVADVVLGGEDGAITSVKAADGTDMLNTIIGIEKVIDTAESGPFYRFDITGLPDGVYTATLSKDNLAALVDVDGNAPWADQTFKFVVDRTAPSATSLLAAAPALAGSTYSVSLPAGLFDDAQSADDYITVSSYAQDDRGLTLSAGAVLKTAVLAPAKGKQVREPNGLVAYTISASDEAGNKAETTFRVPVVSAPRPVITVRDKRGVQTQLEGFVGGPATVETDGKVKLTLYADFLVPVTGMKASSLKCVAQDGAVEVDCAYAATPVFTSSNAGKRYEWSLVLPSSTDGSHFGFTIDVTGVTSTGTPANRAAPGETYVLTVDKLAPTTDYATAADAVPAAYGAAAGVRYLYPIRNDICDGHTKISAGSAPQGAFGLTFFAGNTKTAYLSGVVSAKPAANSGNILYKLTCEDDAGNTADAWVKIRVVAATSVGTSSLTLGATALTFKEGDDDKNIDTGAAVRFVAPTDSQNAITKVRVLLIRPDLAEESAHDEQLIGDSSASIDTYSVDSATDIGVFGIHGTSLTVADVQAFVRSVKYSNDRDIVSSGPRTVRVEIIATVYEGANGVQNVVIAAGTRVVTVTAVNDLPVVDVGTYELDWEEPAVGDDQLFLPLFEGVTVTDVDDTKLSAAYVTIPADDCDAGYDALRVDPAVLPTVEATALYSQSTCTLTITPLPPATGLDVVDVETLLAAVQYYSLQERNAGAFASANPVKNVNVIVEDTGSDGRVATKARSTAGDADAATLALTLVLLDDPATWNLTAAYGKGGVLSSTDPYALAKTVETAEGDVFKVLKFPVALPAEADIADIEEDPVEYTFTFDFSAVTGKDGVYAKGAVVDVDSKADGYPVVAYDGDDIDDTEYTIAAGFTATWTAGDNDVYTLTLSMTKAYLANDAAGELEFAMRWDHGDAMGDELAFYVDVRRKACILSDAENGPAEGDNVDVLYPSNDLCTFAPEEITAGSADKVEVSRGGFTDKDTALAAKSQALLAAGASKAARVAALADERAAARGSFGVVVPPGALASRGSIALTADTAAPTTIAALPPAADPKETIDTSVAVVLGPAGTTFAIPLQICVFAGDSEEDSYKVLMVSSQRDPNDVSKGYLPWEVLSDQTFDVATGKVCGSTDHFSVFAPATRSYDPSPTVTKKHMMGGSCPNLCSGHGYCRQNGQCLCFAGFEGYDCNSRTCPSAPSWGDELEAVHAQAECAGRGVCDRSSGQCQCFDGYDGSACERIACPNDCSGHGRCRMLEEFAEVKATGYSSWENRRIQRCFCDPGYTGNDCSQRACPYGDDPETNCDTGNMQVQKVVLDFGVDPTGTGFPNVDLTQDQIAFVFMAQSGANFSTPTIDDVWDGSATATTNFANALRSLPEFAVTDVIVTSTPTDTQSLKVEYQITFSGLQNSGNEKLLACPFNFYGAMGCTHSGCRPVFKQLRILDYTALPASVSVNPYTVVYQPPALNAGDDTTAGVYGVATTLVISKYVTSSGTLYTYKFTNTKIYGETASSDGTVTADVIEETPIPPAKLREGVAGPYGLLVDFASDAQLSTDYGGSSSGPWSYDFKWRLPSCTVTDVKASEDLEKSECSNRGLCNRNSGECECFNGYAGYACNQQTVYV